ncbi:hypothetical protein, partial [Klebsiella pneumoniae]|uniref:hypothetical protein n=2 Tax=Klebsiella pneumoniae TaxID=573 RepID=UPI001950F443
YSNNVFKPINHSNYFMLKEAKFSLLELLKDLSSLIKDKIPAQPFPLLRAIKFLRRKGYVLNHFFQRFFTC